MIVSIIGDCDRRPVLYTVIKILQTIGDTLVISTDNRILRLSDTREDMGHYQNTMIAFAPEGIDDFLEEFTYSFTDFSNVIIDGMTSDEADQTIYVKGLMPSEEEEALLEYLEGYATIKLYEGKAATSAAFLNCEKFEAYRQMTPINATIGAEVAEALSKVAGTSATNLSKMAAAPPTGSVAKGAPQTMGVPHKEKKKSGLFGGGKK